MSSHGHTCLVRSHPSVLLTHVCVRGRLHVRSFAHMRACMHACEHTRGRTANPAAYLSRGRTSTLHPCAQFDCSPASLLRPTVPLQVKETGDVITFEGIYAADRGQAAAVTFYTFCGAESMCSGAPLTLSKETWESLLAVLLYGVVTPPAIAAHPPRARAPQPRRLARCERALSRAPPALAPVIL
jgi:hypothetical protein